MFENLLLQGKELLSQFSLTYLILVNCAGFILMGWDKFLAKMAKRRIPEKSLFFVAIIGGSLGSWLGMQIFRHKTRHAHFVIGMPLIILLQAAAALLLYYS